MTVLCVRASEKRSMCTLILATCTVLCAVVRLLLCVSVCVCVCAGESKHVCMNTFTATCTDKHNYMYVHTFTANSPQAMLNSMNVSVTVPDAVPFVRVFSAVQV